MNFKPFVALAARLLTTLNITNVCVPDFASGSLRGNNDVLFSSRYLHTVSPIDAHLPHHRDEAAAIVAVDTWLCNRDRNIGNYLLTFDNDVGESLMAIDFEKCAAAQDLSRLELELIDHRAFWPREAARRILGRLPWPEATIARIERLDLAEISRAADETVLAFPCFTWKRRAVDSIARRATSIRTLAKQVWNDCNP